MTQVNSSPGVPGTLPTVTASSATPIWAGPVLDYGVVNTTVAQPVFTTGGANVWPAVLVEQGKVVSPFKSSTPIVLPTQQGLFP